MSKKWSAVSIQPCLLLPLHWSNIQIKTQPHRNAGGLALQPAVSAFDSTSAAFSTAAFKSNNYTKWFMASCSQRSEQSCVQEHSRHSGHSGASLLLVFFQIFPGMQEFSASHSSIPSSDSSPLPTDSWAMACPAARAVIEKAWLLAAGRAAICESEWLAECCVGGRGGRGSRESQTASRREQLTPHRCHGAPEVAPFFWAQRKMRKKGDYPTVRVI